MKNPFITKYDTLVGHYLIHWVPSEGCDIYLYSQRQTIPVKKIRNTNNWENKAYEWISRQMKKTDVKLKSEVKKLRACERSLAKA